MFILGMLGEMLGDALLEGVLALLVLAVKGLFQAIWSLFMFFVFIGRLMAGRIVTAHQKVQGTPLQRTTCHEWQV